MSTSRNWFEDARYGLFIHYGLYSLLERGEWVMNKEQIPVAEYARLADRFTAEQFDADDLLGRAAKDWGMRYAVLTTKHHEGFCLYDSKLTDFTAPKNACGRDLVAEFVTACRKHGLRIGLYHSLNDWSASPNAVDALERPDECYRPFIEYAHGQIREIMSNYGKIDVMWYDGWWPFDGDGWQADRLNAMVRGLQPGVLVNGRCGKPGDFGTPEGHVSAQAGMWEACMTLNENWGYHAGDTNWKSPKTVAGMLRQVACGKGNLLLNVGPRGDGSVPEATIDVLNRVGGWLKIAGEAVYRTDRFEFDMHARDDKLADWTHHGRFTAAGKNFYLHVTCWPGETLTITGVESTVREARILGDDRRFTFTQDGGRLVVTGLPKRMDDSMPVVMRFATTGRPAVYRSGGHRDPNVTHCRYDPVQSDLQA